MNNLNNEINGREEMQSAQQMPASLPASAGGKKKSSGSWYVTLFCVILAVVITFMATYSILYKDFSATLDKIVVQMSDDSYFDTAVIDTLEYYYETYYVGEIGDIDPESLLYIDGASLESWDKATLTDLIAGLYVAHTGDKYGEYYSPSSMSELENYFAGETVGIGVLITYDYENKTIEILQTMEDSPAEAAGVEAGDFIIRVGDLSVEEASYEQVVNAIKGDEGTKVSITFLHDGKEVTREIERRAVVINTVFGRMAGDGKTGIVRITEFTNETPAQFSKAVEELESLGAERFVFDLRDNGGGTLQGVLGVLSYIFPEGTPLIKEVDKSGKEELGYSSTEHEMNCPMAVLVNENTASAAELFTINMRDYEKATIVGVKTYGKGVMQTFFELPNGGMVKLTFKWYSSVLSDNYDGIGIEPHVVEEMDAEFASTNLFKLADEDDNQLQTALEILNK